MNDYMQVRFDVEPCSEMATDVLAAVLAEIGYESFVPDERGVTAFVPQGKYDEIRLKEGYLWRMKRHSLPGGIGTKNGRKIISNLLSWVKSA